MTDKRERVTIDCGPSMTKQSFRDECDINFIMSRWKRTGQMPTNQVGTMPPSYGDFSNPTDYMSALNQVLAAKEAFASLPAFLRDRFANEPANLLRFLSMPENQEEAIKLGLARAPATETSPAPPDTSPETSPDTPPPGETGGDN